MSDQQPPQQQRCPTCGGLVSHVTVVCMKCGTNLKTGQQFGTQVETRKPRRPKSRLSLITNLSFLCALGIVIGAVVLYNKFQAKFERELAEQMKVVNSHIAKAEELTEQSKFGEVYEKYQNARKELEAYREMAGKNKRGIAKADKKADEIERKEKETRQLEQSLARAREEKERQERDIAQKRAKGLEEFQGEWLTPAQIQAKGYRKIAGEWVPVDELVKRHGYAFYRGEYRSPDDMKGFGLRHFEGTWRTADYIRQAKGEVKLGDEWLTEEEMLRRLPQKVCVRIGTGRETEYVGEVVQNDDKYVKIVQWIPSSPRKDGPEQPAPPPEGQPIVNLTRKEQGWSKSMYKVRLEDISGPYRDALKKMASRNPSELEAGAKWWESESRPEMWPNGLWKAQRARELAALIRAGRGDDIGRFTNPVTEPLPQPPKPAPPAAATPAPSPAPASSPVPAAKTHKSEPALGPNTVTILADEVKLLEGNNAVATAKKGQLLTFVRPGKTGHWLVEGEFDGKSGTTRPERKRLWLTPRDVLITADEAKLMAGTSAVAVARKGQTLDFIRYGERGLVLVQGLFDGQAKKGWLTTPKDGVVRELAKATVVVQPNQTPLMVHSQEIAKLNKGQSAAFQHLDDKDNYALVELVLDGKKVQGWVAKTALFGPEPPLAGKAAKAK